MRGRIIQIANHKSMSICSNICRFITVLILLLWVTESVGAQSHRKQNEVLLHQFDSLKRLNDRLVMDWQRGIETAIVFTDSFEINKTRYMSHQFLSKSTALILELRELKQFNARPDIENLVDTLDLIAAIDYRTKLFWKKKTIPLYSKESKESPILQDFQLPARERNYETWNEQIRSVNNELVQNIDSVESKMEALREVFIFREEFLFYLALSDRLQFVVEEQLNAVKQQLTALKKVRD
jgi:hypothetical protein